MKNIFCKLECCGLVVIWQKLYFSIFTGDSIGKHISYPSEQKSNSLTHRQTKSSLNSGQLQDLIYLPGPLTEDAVLKCLLARFSSKQYCVSILYFINYPDVFDSSLLSLLLLYFSFWKTTVYILIQMLPFPLIITIIIILLNFSIIITVGVIIENFKKT